jgi:hypothetical protein
MVANFAKLPEMLGRENQQKKRLKVLCYSRSMRLFVRGIDCRNWNQPRKKICVGNDGQDNRAIQAFQRRPAN